MSDEEKNQIRQLTRLQRRVLGTLMEKGFTTPDQYPMTLKGATTGCNQKSNRDPVTEYSEAELLTLWSSCERWVLSRKFSPMVGERPDIVITFDTNLILRKHSLRFSVNCCYVGGNSPVNCERGRVAWSALTAKIT